MPPAAEIVIHALGTLRGRSDLCLQQRIAGRHAEHSTCAKSEQERDERDHHVLAEELHGDLSFAHADGAQHADLIFAFADAEDIDDDQYDDADEQDDGQEPECEIREIF